MRITDFSLWEELDGARRWQSVPLRSRLLARAPAVRSELAVTLTQASRDSIQSHEPIRWPSGRLGAEDAL